MKTNYILLLVGLLLVSCAKQTNSENVEKPKTTKGKKVKEHAEAAFTNQQISNLEYQIEAFKIGSEKVVNAELKDYLSKHISDLQTIQSEYKTLATTNNIEVKPITDNLQKDLYKLAIADAAGFDKVFIHYYKAFLSKTMKNNAEVTNTDPAFTTLKNKYGNILYEHKLYFDMLK